MYLSVGVCAACACVCACLCAFEDMPFHARTGISTAQVNSKHMHTDTHSRTRFLRFVPLKMGGVLRGWGITNIVELDWWQGVRVWWLLI